MPVSSLQKLFSRREFLASLGVLGVGSCGYARFLEPGWLQVGRHEVRIDGEPRRSPLKILHLSDLHASPEVELSFIAQAIQLGLNQQPDLICLTGDFITRGYREPDGYAEVLLALTQAAPTFACLGNHDGGLWAARRQGYRDTNRVRGLLARAGIELLHNAAKTVRLRDRDLKLVGLGDPWAGEFQPVFAFPEPPGPANPTTVVLSHNPDTKDQLKPHPWDLLLCGHTHGGQVRLPLLGTPFAPVRDKRFMAGLHRWDGRWLHVTRGVGNRFGVRFNCPPEVSLLTLV